MPRKDFGNPISAPIPEGIDVEQEKINLEVFDNIKAFIIEKIKKVVGKDKNYDIKAHSHVASTSHGTDKGGGHQNKNQAQQNTHQGPAQTESQQTAPQN